MSLFVCESKMTAEMANNNFFPIGFKPLYFFP